VIRKDKAGSEAKAEEFSMYYRVYNQSNMHCAESPPIVVIHGGPSLPSNYLYPLVQQFGTSRSIIFYDQLGCGQSSAPEDRNGTLYSIANAVDDLKELIQHLRLKTFHLLGHSFGGIIAYEFAKSNILGPNSKCLSLILDSTPSSMKLSLDESSRLEEEVKNELGMSLEGMETEEAAKLVHDHLRRRSECRLDEMPDSLVAAIEQRGTEFGPEAVSNYVAYPPPSHSLPPVLLIRGQYDFITEKCIEGWREIFKPESSARRTSYREEEMRNCSHYCHLEDAQSFGDLIKSHCFINDY
jgi:pimeloyl-ACP methyl ester carboxylesterase